MVTPEAQSLMSIRSLLHAFIALLIGAALSACGGGGGGGGGGTTPPPPLASTKSLLSFSILGVAGTISEPAHTVDLTLPYGTSLTALVASYTSNGAGVSVGGVPQSSGVTPNDFTAPVSYRVTAEDGSSAVYAVRVALAPRCPGGQCLGGVLSGLSSGESIQLSLQDGQRVSLSSNGAFVFPGGLTVGSAYQVQVLSAPAGKTCSLLYGVGSVATRGVDRVQVRCDVSVAPLVWTQGPNPVAARVFHTATRLNDGRVLVAGGYSARVGGVKLSSAEIFDPATDTWTATGSMNLAHAWAGAALLPNGKVLVAGGDTNESELYDPATGQWTRLTPMQAFRTRPITVVLPSGKVLVAAGDSNPTAEVFDPTTLTWTSTPAMRSRRLDSRGLLLQDGRVVVVGGFDDGVSPTRNCGAILNTIEVYDESTNTWTTPGSGMHVCRFGQVLELLPDGRVLAGGGFTFDQTSQVDIYSPTYEVLDPVTLQWTLPAAANVTLYGASVFLGRGLVVVPGGGTNASAVFDVAAGTWGLSTQSNLGLGNSGHTMTPLLDGRTLHLVLSRSALLR